MISIGRICAVTEQAVPAATAAVIMGQNCVDALSRGPSPPANRRVKFWLQGDRAINAFWIIGIIVNIAFAAGVFWYVIRSMRPPPRERERRER